MDVPAYLQRIEYAGPLKPDAQTLRGLQIAHMQHIPFENLDIGLRRPIVLNERALWDKLIVRKRGGFCYELNGLFAWLLREIGFDVTHLNARVYNPEGQLGIEFDHLALLVLAPGNPTRWLADAGFGDSFNEPLNLEQPAEQVQGLRVYRLEETTNGFVTWQHNYDGSWERQYYFDLVPRSFPDDYQSACLYHQTSPKSGFTRKSIISQATPDGRVSLEDGRLILTRNGERSTTMLESEAEYQRLLQLHFGISSL